MIFDDYYTAKNVVIREPTLGRTYYIFCLLVVLYTVNNVIINKGFLEFDPHTIGAMRMHLKNPESYENEDNLPYCKLAENGCLKMDSQDIVYPDSQEESIFITTYIKDLNEKRECLTCEWKDYDSQSYYVVQPESYFIRLRHTYMATTFYDGTQNTFSESNEHMVGTLRKGWGPNAAVMTTWNKFQPDDIYISALLNAGNVTLNDKSGVFDHENDSIRLRGGVLCVAITYTNVGHYGITEPTYQLRTVRLPEIDYRVSERISISPLERTIRRRYGIQIKFFQQSNIGRFSTQALLFHIISGLGLLQISTFVVDFLALYLMTKRQYYNNMKYSINEIVNEGGVVTVKKSPLFEKKHRKKKEKGE